MAIPKRRVGLRLRLGLWAAIGALMVLLMMVLAREGLGRVARADAESHAIATAGSFQQDGDLTSNAMHASTLESLVVDHGGTLMVPEVAAEALKVRADLESAGETRNPEIRRALAQMRPRVERFIAFAEQVTALATSDRQAALAQVPAFERAFDDLAAEQSALTRLFAGARIDQLAVSHATGRDVSHRILLVTLAVIAAWLLVAILLSRFAVGALASIARVTDAIVRGDRDARNAVVHDDEFGHVAGSVNSMADSLTELIARIEGEAVRDTFSKQLAEAFEISDQEPQVHAVVGRAMVSVAEQTPMELLLADSSEAALERAVEHPTAGAPGCHVTSPFSCVAVRRGTAVVFEDSEALNACPHLRGRPEGARSAACVPVTFMGRALGVLHASAESGSPPGSDQVGRMKVLAEQAGARIGTVRAFQETQLQATTDPLTGALNRRTIENRLRGLLDNGGLVSLAMLDLDHFKQLNDTHGHSAGDRALRHFTRILTATVRDSDQVARFGGEEFVVLFPEAKAGAAMEVLERVRVALAESLIGAEHPYFTFSAGVTDSLVGNGAEDLLRIADNGLYSAKHAGRDCTRPGTDGVTVAERATDVDSELPVT